MRLGIDFGTTHTVAALVDRGNFPLVPFDERDVIPSLVAAHQGGQIRYGTAAAQVAQEPGWTVLRSIKRLLQGRGPESRVRIGSHSYPLSALLTGFLAHVRTRLLEAAGLEEEEELICSVAVPASAGSAQRLLTVDAFRSAGFDVVRMLGEPSAAALEYAHRHHQRVTSKREHVLIYDLGGGTFDASVLHLDHEGGEVISTLGLSTLGGDDFDEALLGLALAQAGLEESRLSPAVRAQLLDECRVQKEAALPQTRRLVIDLAAAGAPPVTLPAEEAYAACAPLVEETLRSTEEALEAAGLSAAQLSGIYVVGGQSSFPPVYRTLRERFGELRVKRSPHPFGSIAIGLAIQLADASGWLRGERLGRHFGVFREADAGRDVAYDVLLAKDTLLPAPGQPPLEVRRRYRAVHNVGHFRFFECARLRSGKPEGSVALWDDLRFPFDRRLRTLGDLSAVPVERLGPDEWPEVEEVVRCGPGGEVWVELRDLSDGYTRTTRLGPRDAPAHPA